MAELEKATNNFAENNYLGEGMYAKVYKGMLRHTAVAIKRFVGEGEAGELESRLQ